MIIRKIHWRAFLILSLTLGAVFLLTPLASQAAWYDFFTPTGLISGAIGLILKTVLNITGKLVEFANWLVTWTLTNPFNISYTRPGLRPPDNFIIEIGWTLLRDLINMAFILGLAYIGFATALDFNTKSKFDTRKTFINLLLIALLINFTPAICGAVVDVGNILGSFFVQGADFSILASIFHTQQQALTSDWADIITNGTLMFSTLILIAFGLVSALVLGMYGVLFLARGPIIWFLVILSPGAFFCYIFDKTKKTFDQWWELFLQWALILPVVLGFFLYLAMQILARTNEILTVSGNNISGMLNRILPYTIPLGFLIAGLLLTMSKLMGGGAKGILGIAKGAGIGLAAAVGGGAIMAGKKGVASGRNYLQRTQGTALKPGEEGYDEWKNQSRTNQLRAAMNTAGRFAFGGATEADKARWGTGGQAISAALRVGGAAATLGATFWARPALKRISAKVGGAIDDEQDKKFDKRVDDLKSKPVTTLNAALENAMPGIVGRQERLAVAKAIIDSKKPLKAFTALTPAMRRQLIEDAIDNGKPDIINHFKPLDPMIMSEVVKNKKLSKSFLEASGLYLKEEDKEKYMIKDPVTGTFSNRTYKKERKDANGNVMRDANGNALTDRVEIDPLAAKIMAGARISQMESFSVDTIKIAADSDLINDFWNGDVVRKAGELLGYEALEAIRKNIKTKEYYTEKQIDGHGGNKQLGNYIGSQAGQALGFNYEGEKEIDFKAERTRLTNEQKQINNDLQKLKNEYQQTTTKQQETQTMINNINIDVWKSIGKPDEDKLKNDKKQLDDELNTIKTQSQELATKLAELEEKKLEKAQELADLKEKEDEAKGKKA